jgi:DNA-binding phage protein
MAGLTTPVGVANTFAALPAPLQVAASHLGFGGGILDAALEYIGITREQYQTEAEAGKTLTEIAVESGKTREGLVAAMVAAGQTELVERVERVVDEDPPLRDGHKFKAFFGDLTEAAVTYIGLTREEVMTQLQGGSSLAEIAVASGKTREGLVAAMVAEGNAAIDEAEANGRITAEQAATAREALPEKVERIVDADKPFGPPFGRGRGHGPGGRPGAGL